MPKGVKLDRDKLVPQICERLSKGEPLAVICRDIGISRRTVNSWREQDSEIAAQFDEARDVGFDAIAAECLEIADNPLEGTEIVTRGNKTEVHTGDMLGHRKLQIETRLKLLAKWDKKRYGDRVQLSNDPDEPFGQLSDDQVAARFAELMAKASKGTLQ